MCLVTLRQGHRAERWRRGTGHHLQLSPLHSSWSDPKGWLKTGDEFAGSHEEDIIGIGRGEAADPLRSCSMAGSGKRTRKSAIPLALPLRCLSVPSNAPRNRSHFPYFSGALESLVIRTSAKCRDPKFATESFDGPGNACYQLTRPEGSSVPGSQG